MKRNIYTDALIRLLILFIMSLTVCGIIGLLCSCRTCRQESVTERSDTLMRNTVDSVRIFEERIDSVVVRDSVFTLVKGDTIFVKEWHWRDRISEAALSENRTHADTLWRTRTVTVSITRTLPPVEVEKPLSWWNRTLIGIGYLAIGAVVAAGVFLLRRLRK